jgi:hypothetical protein
VQVSSSVAASSQPSSSSAALFGGDSDAKGFGSALDSAVSQSPVPTASVDRTPNGSSLQKNASASSWAARRRDTSDPAGQTGLNSRVVIAPVAPATSNAYDDLLDISGDSQEPASGLQTPPAIPASLPNGSLAPQAPATPAVTVASEVPPESKVIAAPLSFAAKIQAPQTSATTQTQHSVLNDNVATVASEWKKSQHDTQATVADADCAAPGSPHPVPANLNTLAPVPQPSNSLPNPIARQETPALSAVKQVETPAATPSQTAGTQLKDVSFRIAQADGSSIQLRLVQQSGELRVAVHAASPELNQGLRDSLPDLTKKLSDGGFHSETWRPGVPTTGAPAEAQGSRNQNSTEGGGNSDSQSNGRGQRQHQQSQQPRWVDELENSTQSTSLFQGELNGIRN